MTEEKRNRLNESLLHASSEFVSQNGPEGAMVTVTNFSLSDNLKSGVVLFTVLPDKKSDEALKKLNRSKSDFTKFVRSKIRSGNVPQIEFILDESEKILREALDEK